VVDNEGQELIIPDGSYIDVSLAGVERTHILQILNWNKGNKTKTAKALKIGLRTLQRKLKKYEAEGAICT
jgi:transcriptional regulator with PAS, ATPase and Fis domain